MSLARLLLATSVLAGVVASGCASPPAASGGGGRKVGGARPLGSTAPVATGPTTRVVAPQGLAVATLVGKAKLLSDMGSALISDMGSAIISNNSGALVGKAKYGLLQAGGPVELLLADAVITVHDAGGRQLVGEGGKPLQAVTDATGSYELRAALPEENLLLKDKLFNGGELVAIAARQGAQTRTETLDTASTLGATYVLDRFVKGSQQTFDRLPAAEAETLRTRLAAAQGLIKQAPSYRPADSVALAEAIRQQDTRVAESFEAIKALLLGGLGDGRAATRVALNKPRALALLPDGALLIGETDLGRIRRLMPDGTQTLWLDGRSGEIRDNLIGLEALLPLPDGSVLAAASNRSRVYRLGKGTTPEVVLGSGKSGGPYSGVDASAAGVVPWSIAAEPDGTLWVAQESPPMLLRVPPGGKVEAVSLPPGMKRSQLLHQVVVGGPQGALHLLTKAYDAGGDLFRRNPDGSWSLVAGGRPVDEGGFTVAPDGTIYLCEDLSGSLVELSPAGAARPLPGPTEPGRALSAPAGIVRAPDGTLFVSDLGTNLVHARDPGGAWRLVAGNQETVQAGADRITFNVPASLAFDPQGRLVVAEGGGHALKRWDGKVLETIAGGARGFAGDAGPASAARFDTPGAVAFRGDELLVSDVFNGRIRSIGADGTIRTIVGGSLSAPFPPPPLAIGIDVAPKDLMLRRVTGLAVGTDGSLYWSSMTHEQILRLSPDGRVRVVAGRLQLEASAPDEPDGPALERALATPAALAFRPGEPDNLYFTELASCRVRRIVGVTGPAPRLETVAGIGLLPTAVRLGELPAGWEASENGKKATEALVVAPMGLAFGPDGALYVSEGGTTNVKELVANAGDVIGALELPRLGARVRRVAPDGAITTLMGPGGKLHPDPDAEDAIGLPGAMAFDASGRLAIIDARSNSVRLVPAEAFR